MGLRHGGMVPTQQVCMILRQLQDHLSLLQRVTTIHLGPTIFLRCRFSLLSPSGSLPGTSEIKACPRTMTRRTTTLARVTRWPTCTTLCKHQPSTTVLHMIQHCCTMRLRYVQSSLQIFDVLRVCSEHDHSVACAQGTYDPTQGHEPFFSFSPTQDDSGSVFPDDYTATNQWGNVSHGTGPIYTGARPLLPSPLCKVNNVSCSPDTVTPPGDLPGVPQGQGLAPQASHPQMQEEYFNWTTSNMNPADHYGHRPGSNMPHNTAYQYAIGHGPKIAGRIARQFYHIDPDVWSRQTRWSVL